MKPIRTLQRELMTNQGLDLLEQIKMEKLELVRIYTVWEKVKVLNRCRDKQNYYKRKSNRMRKRCFKK